MTKANSTPEDLRTSEIRYRRLFEAARDGILILDALTLTITDVNPYMTELLGYSRAEFLGKELWEIGLFRDKEASKEAFQRLQETGYLRYDDLPLQTTIGETRQVEFVSNVYEEDGHQVIQCNIRNITEHKRRDDALRRSKEQLASVIGSAMDAIISIDEDQRIILFNAAAERMFLCPSQEAIGQSVENFIPKRFRPAHREHIDEFVRTHVTKRTMGNLGAIFGLRSDGEEFPIEASISQVVSDGGKIGTVILRDISERKRTEEERAQLTARIETQRQRLNNIVANVPGVVWEAWGQPDATTQRINFVSEYVETMLGYSVQEWLSTPNFWLSIVHPDDRERAAREATADFAAGKPITKRDFRWVAKDGRVLWVESQSTVAMNDQGQPVGMRGVTTDISERKQAEEQLRRQLDFNEAITTSLGEGVCAVDQNGRVTFMNPAAEVALGWTQGELLGQEMQVVVHFKNADGTPRLAEDCQLRGGLKSGDSIEIEDDVFTRKDGTMFHVSYSSSPITTSGEIVGAVFAFRDVTERRTLEEELRQSQKMEAVGRLAGGIAHDFNNLLTVINGYSELTLRQLQPDDSLVFNVEEIKRAGKRAASLTRQLLAFSRKQVLQPKVLDLNTVISDLRTMLQRLIGEDVDLRTVLDPELLRVNADPGQIEQVIMNLAVNARDAMPDGGKLTIETENVVLSDEYGRYHLGVKPGPYAMVAISDDGSGMDDETKIRLFEPFYTTKDLDKGTGLGLSTVYGIVKQSMGNIWVYSELGLGTTFKIYLPSVDDEVDKEQPIPTSQPTALATETILLVEDDEMVRTLTRTTLEQTGYKVLKAANGAEALLICERHPDSIHLLITDVVMPGLSGRVVADRLKLLRPQMLVLYMSGYTEDAIVQRGVLNAGVNFIAKPFTTAALTRKVRELIDAAELRIS